MDILQGCVHAITRKASDFTREEEVRQATNEISSIIIDRFSEIRQVILRLFLPRT
jgi:hypothetical protein